MKLLSKEEVFIIAKKEMEEFVDMGCFSQPDVALPYLTEGFYLGYLKAQKDMAKE
jgi:hypothetical protein